MLNLRLPISGYIPAILHFTPYSSSINDQVFRELLKHVTNQDKIKTDRFRKVVPHLKERDSQLVNFKLPERLTMFTEEQLCTADGASDQSPQSTKINELTNILDNLPEMESSILKDKTPQDVLEALPLRVCDPVDAPFNPSTVSPSLTPALLLDTGTPPPQGLAALVTVAPPSSKTAKYYADLSTAILPLSLHRREDSLLMAAVVQDMNQFYLRTSATVNDWLVVANQQGVLLYRTVEDFVNKPGSVQDFARQQYVVLYTLRDKTALWLCDQKAAATPASPGKTEKPAEAVESVIDKIRKTIDGIIASLKKTMEEQSKKPVEDKKTK